MSKYTTIKPAKPVRFYQSPLCHRCGGPMSDSTLRYLRPNKRGRVTHCGPCILHNVCRFPSFVGVSLWAPTRKGIKRLFIIIAQIVSKTNSAKWRLKMAFGKGSVSSAQAIFTLTMNLNSLRCSYDLGAYRAFGAWSGNDRQNNTEAEMWQMRKRPSLLQNDR